MWRALAQSFARVEFIDSSPYFVRLLHFSDTNRRNISARFDHPGRRHALHELANLIVTQEWNKVGHINSGCSCSHTHCKLIAEESGGRAAHAGQAKMLANLRRCDHVILLKRDNAVYPVLSSHKAH